MLSHIRRYLPHVLIGVSISLIMIAAYAAVGFSASATPKATWATNPLTIIFPATAGTGSATDSFTCSPSATGIVLQAKASTGKVSLTTTPTSFSSCGPAQHTVTLIVHCLVSAALCKGSYSGLVQIRQPANYRDIPANLVVRIVVT